MPLQVLFIGSLLVTLLMSCATDRIRAGNDKYADVAAENCGTVPALSEDDMRMTLLYAKRRWDTIQRHVQQRVRMGTMTEDQMQQFTVQDSEFSKFYTNALMLYLRGDLSDDICRSLYTLQELIVLAESCNPGIEGSPASSLLLNKRCETVEPSQDDGNRRFLYRSKTDWDEFFIVMMSRQIRGNMSVNELNDLKGINEEFIDAYSSACLLYLGGGASSEEFSQYLSTLESIRERSDQMMRQQSD